MTTKMKWPAPEDPLQVQSQLWADWTGELGWDIGANIGQTIERMLVGFTRVLAFEPNDDPYRELEINYGQEERVRLFNAAVSDVNGTINLAAMPPQMEYGMLITPETHGLRLDEGADWSDIPHMTVPSCTVDHLATVYGVPDFCKVDTEGHEGHILRGAAHVLSTGQTDWLVEFHNPPLHKFCTEVLEDHGYEVETVRHPNYAAGTMMWRTHGWVRAKAPRGRNAHA